MREAQQEFSWYHLNIRGLKTYIRHQIFGGSSTTRYFDVGVAISVAIITDDSWIWWVKPDRKWGESITSRADLAPRATG